MSEGSVSEGNISEGNISEGNASEGNASGGNASGGSTSGGSTSGGSTRGGSTRGGNVGRGNGSGGNGDAARLFSGVGVALVTIFGPDGAVDEAATARHAADLARRGMRVVLVAGTTGEAGKLTDGERVGLIRAVRAALPDDVPVLAGTGAASADGAVRLTKTAVEAGADGVLAYPPPDWDSGAHPDLPAFYAAVAKAAAGKPVLAYHVPWVSSPGVPVESLPKLPVAGIKDSSGSADRLLDELTHYAGATYVGSSALLALAGPMGGAGAILAIANVEPELCSAAFAGDGGAQLRLAPTHLAVRTGGPAELKRLLAGRGDFPATSRLA
ncbi:MAG TPA: dihydrodipicolinate synthase family protein [Streptosporangiaceae bacterium]|nr:dihydrodipicolinate synthase family protein [Streptosporangiaceae bacterium]